MYFLKYTKQAMTLVGLWTKDISSTSSNRTYNTFRVGLQIYFILFILTVAGGTIGIEDSDELKVGILYLLFYIVCSCKIMILRSKKIKYFIEKIGETDKQVMKGNDKQLKKIYTNSTIDNFRVYFILQIISFIVYIVTMLISVSRIKIWKSQVLEYSNNVTIKPLLYNSWYPFAQDKYVTIITIHQVTNMILAGSYNVACETLFISLVIFATVRLKMLNYKFLHFGEYCRNMNKCPKEILKDFVIEHANIIMYVEDLGFMKWYFFGDFIGKSYHISLMIFYLGRTYKNGITDLDFIFGVFGTALNICQLSFLYYHAHDIILEGANISKNIYQSNWYEQSAIIKRSFLIIMVRSLKPLGIRLGVLDIININILLKIIKAGYTCILLSNVY